MVKEKQMKAIIPLAGLGTRLRPHTLTRPKPLVDVAGKAILGHVLDRLEGLPIVETIFITGYLGDQIEGWVKANYSVPSRFVEQKELKGQAHAIYLTREYIDQPVLIVFVDTIFETDLSRLPEMTEDGAILVREVTDPRRFGVAVLQDGFVTKLVEKPKRPVSNLAVVGVYYIRNYQLFVECLGDLLDRDIKTAGEYYLADALQLMIDRGAKISALSTDVWEDTGTTEALLQTNRYLLKQVGNQVRGETSDTLVIPPVYVGPGAKLTNTIVGPNVSIGAGAVIADSVMRDCIIGESAQIHGAVLADSVIGSNAIVQWQSKRLSVSDFSQVELG
jgi:glucose-1-phosphate thymidylyltransferase